jgi:hypothetical protein
MRRVLKRQRRRHVVEVLLRQIPERYFYGGLPTV